MANIGDRAGSTVVQIYVRDEEASVSRPEKELKGFAKVALAPGERRTVTLTLDMRALAFFDVAGKRWVAEAGEFLALAGFSSAEIVSKAAFRLSDQWFGVGAAVVA